MVYPLKYSDSVAMFRKIKNINIVFILICNIVHWIEKVQWKIYIIIRIFKGINGIINN